MLDLDKETFFTVRFRGEEMECYVGNIVQESVTQVNVPKDNGTCLTRLITRFTLISLPYSAKSSQDDACDVL